MSEKEIEVFIDMVSLIAAKAICDWCHCSKEEECIKPSFMGDAVNSELKEVVNEWISIRGI